MKKPIKNNGVETIRPMLANKVADKTIDFTEKVFAQRKFDGIRCIITSEGAFTRTGKEIMNVEHIKRDLDNFFDQFPDKVLDGEIYNHDLKHDFEQIISLSRKSVRITQEDRDEAAKKLYFYFYDVIDDTLNYDDRHQFIEDTFYYNNFSSVRFADAVLVKSMEDITKFHEKSLELGYEGSIVRLNRPYEQKRSKNLLKVKDFHDTEATIIGYVEGKGKRLGMIGKFLARDAEGIEFGMPVMAKVAVLQEIWDNREDYIGQEATFTYFQRTKANSYRHPLFKALRNYE